MRSPLINKFFAVAAGSYLAMGCGGLARSGVSDEPPSQINSPQKFPLPVKSGDAVVKQNIPAAPEKPPVDPKLEAEDQSLSGLWLKDCVKGGIGEPSSKSALEFSRNVFSVYTYKYSDNNCQLLISQSRVEGSYKLTVSDAAGINAIDLMYEEKVYYRFFSDKALKEASANKVCGRSSWRQGVEEGCVENVVKSVFDIVKISPATIAFGAADATHDGSAAEKRFVLIDESSLLQKKK